MDEWPISADDWAAYYRHAPAALAIRECVRLAAVREIDLPEPILDVGCGDGLFARLAYPSRQVWGIDVDVTEVRRAQASDVYRTLICADICRVDLPERFFASAVANCSLEHVPDIGAALRNIRGALREGAPFVLIVPASAWTEELLTRRVLDAVGLEAVGGAYGAALDRVFRHHHIYDPEGWEPLLRDAGFDLEEARPLVRRATSFAFDAMLPVSTLGWLMKQLTGRWVAVPAARRLTAPVARRAAHVVAGLAGDSDHDRPGEWMLVARARGESPAGGADR